MNNLSAILREYVIGDSGAGVVFGRSEGEAKQPPLDVERLVARLDGQSRFNNRIIVSIVASYLAILAIAAILAVMHRDDVKWMAGALGGNLLTLAGSVGWVRSLWREKNYMDMLLALLPSLTAAEALKTLRAFYFEKVSAAGAARRPIPQSAATARP